MQIDWTTLAIQAINIAILIWLLGRFFWRPVSEMIAQRRMLAAQTLADAEAKRQQADASLAEIARTRAGFAQERSAMLDAAQTDAAALLEAKREETRQLVQSMLAQAHAAQETYRADAEAGWESNARDLAVSIAARLSARLSGEAVTRVEGRSGMGMFSNVQTTRAPAKEPSKARQILDAAKARQDMKRQSRWVKKSQGVYGQ